MTQDPVRPPLQERGLHSAHPPRDAAEDKGTEASGENFKV